MVDIESSTVTDCDTCWVFATIVFVTETNFASDSTICHCRTTAIQPTRQFCATSKFGNTWIRHFLSSISTKTIPSVKIIITKKVNTSSFRTRADEQKRVLSSVQSTKCASVRRITPTCLVLIKKIFARLWRTLLGKNYKVNWWLIRLIFAAYLRRGYEVILTAHLLPQTDI